jgi:hypothetical protein
MDDSIKISELKAKLSEEIQKNFLIILLFYLFQMKLQNSMINKSAFRLMQE